MCSGTARGAGLGYKVFLKSVPSLTIVQEIVEDLEAALGQFREIEADLGSET